MEPLTLDPDVFSSGVVLPKLWAIEHLEKLTASHEGFPDDFWVLGDGMGWFAHFMLMRGRLPVHKIHSFDLNYDSKQVADTINEPWVWDQWKFKSWVFDYNELEFSQPEPWSDRLPHWVIHPYVDGVEIHDWWDQLPEGQKVLLLARSSSPTSYYDFDSVMDMQDEFKMTEVMVKEEMTMKYQDSEFKHLLLIGKK